MTHLQEAILFCLFIGVTDAMEFSISASYASLIWQDQKKLEKVV
jgi:hypothetical protein